MRRILTAALLALALIGGVAAVRKSFFQAPPPSAADLPGGALAEVTPKPTTDDLPLDGVVVTYFTSDVRCPSCLLIEALTRQAVESHFKGRAPVTFRTINLDQEEGQPFIERYELVSKTVIVSERKEGREVRWLNLQDVWLKLGSPVEFDEYVTRAIQDYLAHPSS